MKRILKIILIDASLALITIAVLIGTSLTETFWALLACSFAMGILLFSEHTGDVVSGFRNTFKKKSSSIKRCSYSNRSIAKLKKANRYRKENKSFHYVTYNVYIIDITLIHAIFDFKHLCWGTILAAAGVALVLFGVLFGLLIYLKSQMDKHGSL